jgi:hypothetical protein
MVNRSHFQEELIQQVESLTDTPRSVVAVVIALQLAYPTAVSGLELIVDFGTVCVVEYFEQCL